MTDAHTKLVAAALALAAGGTIAILQPAAPAVADSSPPCTGVTKTGDARPIDFSLSVEQQEALAAQAGSGQVRLSSRILKDRLEGGAGVRAARFIACSPQFQD
jgi:hypothetical protein